MSFPEKASAFDETETLWERLDDFFALWKLRRKIKHLWQKLTRGWSDDETWNLNQGFAKWMLPRLKRYKQLADCHPGHLTPEAWNYAMDHMIKALEVVLYDDDTAWLRISKFLGPDHEAEKKKWKEVDEGYELLGKYIRHLWW